MHPAAVMVLLCFNFKGDKAMKGLVAGFLLCISSIALAATVTIPLYKVAPEGKQGEAVGTVVATDTNEGLLLIPNIVGLEPGNYGFHIHENPSCDNNGLAAGGHFDPEKHKQHLGPYSDRGHAGDLPVFVVDKTSGKALPTLAPQLTVKDILGRSLMIHVGGDNYFDTPNPLGGGDGRMICGIIQ